MNNRKFVRLDGERIKVLSTGEETTKLRVLITAFGSPERKDLHGEFFHAGTDFGDNLGIPVKAFYEHGMNDLTNPFMPNNRQVIGTAKFVEADEVGRWYEVELMRSHAYHDAILKLIDEGVMGASTQCYPNQRSAPSESGQIDRWLESEVSITPTPADYATIGKAVRIAKSFDLPDFEIAESLAKMVDAALKKDSDEDALADEINALFANNQGSDVPDDTGELSDEVDTEEENSDNNEEEAEPVVGDLSEVTAGIKQLNANLTTLLAELALVKSAVTDANGEIVNLANTELRTRQTYKAMRAMAVSVANNVKGIHLPLEEEEEEVLQKMSYTSPVPAHAPGG